MKKFLTVFIVCLTGLVLALGFANAGDYTRHNALEIQRTAGDDYEDRESFRIDTLGGDTVFAIDSGGTIIQRDSSGNIDRLLIADRIVNIDAASDLSTWSGDHSAGQSYFQLTPGKIHVVDLSSICVGSTSAISAVSAMMWDASSYSGPAYDAEIWLVASALIPTAGATELQIWPYSNGTTSYGKGATREQQTIIKTRYGGASGSFNPIHSVTSGASIWELDTIGEGIVMRADSGAVSAFPVRVMFHKKN